MPGIFGVVADRRLEIDASFVLARMSQPIRYAPDQEVETFVEDACAGGLVDYPASFAFLKPASAAWQGVRLWMDGEVFPDSSEVPHELQDPHPSVQRAEYCLHLYLQHGADFVRRLNGTFAIAIFDGRDRQLHLYTDRFGHQLLFVEDRAGQAAFASSLRSILAARPDTTGEYDRQSLAELVVFERVLRDATLVPGIRRLGAGAHAAWGPRGWRIERYFELKAGTLSGQITDWREASEELLRRLQRSVEKRTADGARTGLMLSGGLDSRLILGTCTRPVVATTFADRNQKLHTEARIAQAAARAVNVPHVWLLRDPDYYARIAPAATAVNEGLCTFVGSHTVGAHDQLEQAGIQVVLTGDRFDTAFKDYFSDLPTPDGLYASEPPELRQRRLARLLVDSPIGRRPDRQDLMMLALSEDLKEVAAVAREKLIQFVSERIDPARSPLESARLLALSDWQCFTTMGFLRGITTHFVERSPYFDNSMLDLSLALPLEWRRGGRLVRHALKVCSRDLAMIRDISTGLPAGLCPPWDGLLLGSRRRAGHLARRLKCHTWLRRGVHGQGVTTAYSWHDRNIALKVLPEYRELVQSAVERLDPTLFDREAVERLLQDDLRSARPRLNHLFEILVTFDQFDRAWRASRSELQAVS